MNLTPRQLDVIVAIRNYRHLHGYSPTMQELADQLGTSKVTIFEHVGALEKKRVLRRASKRAALWKSSLTASCPMKSGQPSFPCLAPSLRGHPSKRSKTAKSSTWKRYFEQRAGFTC